MPEIKDAPGGASRRQNFRPAPPHRANSFGHSAGLAGGANANYTGSGSGAIAGGGGTTGGISSSAGGVGSNSKNAVAESVLSADAASSDDSSSNAEDEGLTSELINLDELLRDYSWKINSDAAALEGKLQAELLNLESENINALIESRTQTRLVCAQLDRALQKLDEMEAWIVGYMTSLGEMSSQVSHVSEQNKLLLIRKQNQDSLLEALETLLNSLTLPKDVSDSLARTPFNQSPENMRRIEAAAEHLYTAMATQLDPDLRHMKLVCEQAGELQSIRTNFGKNVMVETLKILSIRTGIHDGRKDSTSIHQTFSRLSQPPSTLRLFL